MTLILTFVICAVFFVLFLAPTIVAYKRRLKHRVWIAIFNLICFPIAWVMVMFGQRERTC